MESVIKLLREQHRYTQVKLAEELGISRQALIKYENMELEPPLPVIRELSRIFSVSYDCLIDNILPPEQSANDAAMIAQLAKNFVKLNDSEKRAVFEMARIMATC
ncbi:MAG: helix-turn-helix transcriptional regulator [Treponema sp.]|nr:helix-turn-helix transcriptional regulator [Treponema sp.]